jgi:hypothetical protein
MGLRRSVLVFIIAISILLSGCTLPNEENKEEMDDVVSIPEVTNLFPELFVSDTQVGYGEFARLNGTITDENPSEVTIYITLMPEGGNSDDLEALLPFNAKEDGTWTRALPIEEPGIWLIGVYATDITQQSTDVHYINLEMMNPEEGIPTINTQIAGPFMKEEIAVLEGTVEHMFPNTCMVRLLTENGTEIITDTEENGQFEIIVGVLIDNTSVTLEAYCGKWTDSFTSLEIALVLIGADDNDNDGINDEFDSCPEGFSGWLSNTILDYDLDGCRDLDEDTDDDNDGIIDSLDFCSKGAMGWTSTFENDYDSDGCRDVDEDSDDDADGILDAFDACAKGILNWDSTIYDHDSDGCKDDSEEDLDDDNDTVIDSEDSCSKGVVGWISDAETDWDGDGCRDVDEDWDIDEDGVDNSNDECPWTTDYTSVDSDGCDDYQRDTDKDGVRDLDDECEDTPFGLQVSANGCGDRDGDGVTFDLDLCPDTPHELINEVNEFGCADDDFDGVTEDIDNCPNSPERWTIDQNGCAVNQLPVQWNSGPYGTNPMDYAEDFNFDTLSGNNWHFQSEWTGYDNYLFFIKYAASSYNTDLWNQNVGNLIEKLPKDGTHFFFGSFDTTYHSDVYAKRSNVNSYLSTLTIEDEAHWMSHIHYIDERFFSIGGGIGDVRDDWSAFYYGIDNFQRWREVGSLYGWGTSSANYRMDSLAYESQMYAQEFDVEIRQTDPGITPVTIFDQWHNGGWSGGYNSYSNASFPNSSTMSTFNTLELYFYHACDEHKTRYDSDGDGTSDAGCHEWDYLEYLKICDEVNNHSTCGTEFSRYITTYGREGQWLTDVSPFLFMIKEGGVHEFKFSGANKGGLKLVALLSNWDDDGLRPVSGEYLFGGGSFRGQYNDESIYKRQHNLTIPQGLVKAELVALITGHGFNDDNANCAEFCNSEHRFLMNGYDSQQDFPHAGNSSVGDDEEGCMKQVIDGTVANQLGSWPFARAGWCPGMDVKQWMHDITTWIDWSGSSNNLLYQGLYNGVDYQPVNDDGGGSQRIEVASWVVYYENNSGGSSSSSINMNSQCDNNKEIFSNLVLEPMQFQSNFQLFLDPLDTLKIKHRAHLR